MSSHRSQYLDLLGSTVSSATLYRLYSSDLVSPSRNQGYWCIVFESLVMAIYDTRVPLYVQHQGITCVVITQLRCLASGLKENVEVFVALPESSMLPAP